MSLTYEAYTDKNLIVRGNREKYKKQINQLGGRWNEKAKGGAGWVVSKDRTNDIKKLMGAKSSKERKESRNKSKDTKESPRKSSRDRKESPHKSKSPRKSPQKESKSPESRSRREVKSRKESRSRSKSRGSRSRGSRSRESSSDSESRSRSKRRTSKDSKSPKYKAAAAKSLTNHQADTSMINDSDEEDVVSLARKIRSLQLRVNKLEGKKYNSK